MSKVYDTTPFAYVGNNKYYEELSKEELEDLKQCEKEELPTSDEVEESSASVVGQMLPQVGLTEAEEPSVDDLMKDAEDDEDKILKESLADDLFGGENYFESAGFIQNLKNKFKKNNDEANKVDSSKVSAAAKAYTEMRLAASRVKLSVTKNSAVKGTPEYKELKKKVIITEKEYRKLKKDLNKEELEALNQYIEGFDSTFNKKMESHIADIKDASKASFKKESVESECGTTELVTEKDIDPEMKPLIDKLHKKGYQTTASSSGHNNIVASDDSNKNGVRDDHLYSDARLVFKGKYNLGKAPKYWYWKKVDNADDVDYLDIEQIAYDTTPGGPSKAFQDWKIKYMRSLTDWVDTLPDISDDKKEEVEESVCEESVIEDIDSQIDTLYESVFEDLTLDILDI